MKRRIPHFREAHKMRPREASGWPNEVSREAEPAWAFSCAALGGFRVTGLAENRRLEWRATFDEGHRKTECQMRATKYPIRPSSQNGDATFQRRNAARQAAVVRGSRR